MTKTAAFVYQRSITAGTGNLTLVSVAGFRTYATAFPSNNGANPFFYCIRDKTTGEYENGLGYLNGGGELVRATVLESSNSGSAVDFADNMKDITCDVPAIYQENIPNVQEPFTTAEKTKLSGIQTGATLNQSDAYLLARANHTGTQAISTVTGLQAALDSLPTVSEMDTAIQLAIEARDEARDARDDILNNAGFIAVSGDLLGANNIGTVAAQIAAVTTCAANNAAIIAAPTQAANAAASATLAQDWATKTDGLVEATDNSSKAYAIGGVGVTDTPGKGAAKEWSNKTTGTVDGTEYSSKAYAIGGTGKETDNAKYYKEQAEDEADRSQAWAEGTQPGGPGTKSSKEWADESEQFRDEAQMAVGAVRVTVNDTTASVLNDKIVGGNGIATSVENQSGNEQLKLETYPTFDVYSWAKPYLVQSARKALTIKESTIIRLVVDGDARWRRQAADEVLNVESLLDTGSALTAGKDYYLYLCDDGVGGTEFVVSLNSTFPSGYTANNSRKIGGFHTLCVNAGTISGHPLSGYLAGEILPASVWCLNHRPHSNPEGMVYDESQDVWVDIYLQSGVGGTLHSVYGATVTDTRQYSDFMEDQFLVGKALLNDEEFASAMEGSNQKTAISGAASPSPKTAGGHSDTAGRRMISNIGVEEGCGYLWQFLASTSASGGSSWVTIGGNKGNVYGACHVLVAGGAWDAGANCGSRSRFANIGRAYANVEIVGRGRSRARAIL